MTPVLQWLWQGTLIALALTLALRLMPQLNATTRYALGWAGLVVTLLIPTVATWPALAVGTHVPLASNVAAIVGNALGQAREPGQTGLLALPAIPDWLTAVVAGTWLGSFGLGIARIVGGIRYVERLRRTSRPLPLAVECTLAHRQARHTTVRRADLRVSASIDGACALGLAGRPTIVVSERLMQALSPAALDLIVLHEQLHLSRYDDWARLLQTLTLAVCGWHPGVRLISAHLDFEREAACDAAAAALSGSAHRYASSLADAADAMAGWSSRVAPTMVPNATGSSPLVTRIQRLLDPAISRRTRLQGPAFLALSTALAILAAVLVHAGPLMVADPAPDALVESAMAARPMPPAELVAPGPPVRETREEPLVAAQRLNGALATVGQRSAAVATARIVTAAPRAVAAPRLAAGAKATVAAAGGAHAEAQAVQAPILTGDDDLLPSRTLSPLATAIEHLPTAHVETPPATLAAGAAVGERLARVGATTAENASRAGITIGGFFGRAGKAIASRRF